ncbi:MAG: IclR family transcriptional regulator [Candidatus Competibacterales bacterium]
MAKATSIQVIDRMVLLLDAIAAHDEPVGLKQLAKATELHPSTAFRILASLIEHGLVERSGTGNYRLGVRLLQLGSRVQGQLDIRREALPIMEWLRDQIQETVNLIMREGDCVVYVEHATPHRMMRVEQLIGSHAPLHVTAVGKLFLADAGAEACLEYAQRTNLKPCTPHSITEPGRLWWVVKHALKQGYALDDEEAELGVGCIGVPIRDGSGRVVAGFSVSAPIERRQESWVEIIQQAGKRLSVRLGHRE